LDGFQVAYDNQFLTDALRNTIKVDEFTRKLFEIYEDVQKAGGPVQVGSLSVSCPLCHTVYYLASRFRIIFGIGHFKNVCLRNSSSLWDFLTLTGLTVNGEVAFSDMLERCTVLGLAPCHMGVNCDSAKRHFTVSTLTVYRILVVGTLSSSTKF
jgi:hypothetical protein